MKKVVKYITSIPVQNQDPDRVNFSLGFDKNGKMNFFVQDSTELGLDSSYLNERTYPNSGLPVSSRYNLWVSMFMRHIHTSTDEEPNEFD